MRADRLLLLFAKAPRPGAVKTRLIGRRSAEEVTELYAAFLNDLLERLGEGSFAVRVGWATAAGEDPPRTAAPAFLQRGRDLGERLLHGLTEAARVAETMAVVGSDHPDLPVARVEEAFAAVESGCDAALGPTPDGGYYLLALRAEALDARLFEDVPWSTPEVAQRTLERCRQVGLRVSLLPPERDVDREDDVAALAGRLGRPGRSSPRTARLLARWGYAVSGR